MTLSTADSIAIQHDCERLVRAYALAVDSGDADRIAGLFAREGRFARPTDPDNPIVGREAIAESFRSRPGGRVTRHVVSNCVIAPDGPDSARGTSYVVLYQGPAGDGVAVTDKPVFIGGFEDRFVREDGQWRFASRRGSLDLKTG